jgi:NADPH-dependent 2,4-dienoyl-CoA reductase/sulfur reductase-like enzyme
MREPHLIVIVGAGLAGAKAAQMLRESGFGGEIMLLGEEPGSAAETFLGPIGTTQPADLKRLRLPSKRPRPPTVSVVDRATEQAEPFPVWRQR